MNSYEEDLAEMQFVGTALSHLRNKNSSWESNYRTFWMKYEHKDRVTWWRRAKDQAAKGAPAMQQLMVEVIKLKLME